MSLPNNMDKGYEKAEISVTHFVNPQRFWYHAINVPFKNFDYFQKIESDLLEIYKGKPTNSRTVPTIGSLVAVRYAPWDKIIRGRVEDIVEFTNNENECIIWAVDYGFPFQSKTCFIYSLPDEFSKQLDRIRCGAIANIVPAEIEFDYVKETGKLVEKEAWLQRSIDCLVKKITDAATVIFIEHFKSPDNEISFGDLKIINHSAEEFLASKFLIGINVAIEKPDFPRYWHHLKTILVPCYEITNNIFQIVENSAKKKAYAKNTNTGTMNLPVKDQCDEFLKLKVQDWCERNEQLEEIPEKQILKSIPGDTASDIAFDDSVSLIYTKMVKPVCSAYNANHGAQRMINSPTNRLGDVATERQIVSDKSSILNAKSQLSDDAIYALESFDVSESAGSRNPHLERIKRRAEQKINETTWNDNNRDSVNHSSETEKNETHNMSNTKTTTNQMDGKKSSREEALKKIRRKNANLSAKSEISTSSNSKSGTVVENAEVSFEYEQKIRLEKVEDKIINLSLTSSSSPCENQLDDLENLPGAVRESTNSNSVPIIGATHCKKLINLRKKIMNKNAEVQKRMVPAGFDVTNLKEYKDEKTHWHRKETTLGEYHPHDIDTINSLNVESISNQDFRHTRSHTDKYKEESKQTVDTNDSMVMDENHENSFSSKNDQDENVVLEKSIDSDRNTSKDEKQFNCADSILKSKDIIDGNVSFEKQANSYFEKFAVSGEFDVRYPNSRRRPKVNHLSTTIKNEIDVVATEHMREIQGEAHIKTNLTHHLVLAHGKTIIYPLNHPADACFTQEIMQQMEKANLRNMFRIQAYSWPHLIRGNSLFLISPAKSAKTWSYIPPICSLVTHELEEETIPQTYGPVAIILAASAEKAEIISSYCSRILSTTKTDINIVTSYAYRNQVDVQIQLHNGCGILVVTPSNLVRLLNTSESLIEYSRLKHFIIDDMDIMLDRSKEDFQTVLKLILKKETNKRKIPYQLVVTSREWHPIIVNFIKISNQPLLCFGDYLEATVYGKSKISFMLCPKNTKIVTISKYIQDNSIKFDRLLIICNSDYDKDEVVDALTDLGHMCISYGSSSSLKMLEVVEEWKLRTINTQILVCTDMVLPELAIQNVKHLIHYSLPKTWSRFTFRFSTFFQIYDNMLMKNFPPTINENNATNALILLDEKNNSELPRILQFMRKHNQTKYIPKNVLDVEKNIILNREELRAENGKIFCSSILEFGNCDTSDCPYRHQLTRLDKASDGVPTSGDMRVHILKVFSPTHFAARLMRLKRKGSTDWETVRCSDNAAHFAFELNLYYMNPDHHIVHWPLKVGDICIIKKFDNFYRCQILDVPVITHKNFCKSISNVHVKFIDLGIMTFYCSSYLFICADKFKDFPPQAIDIRLLGVKPFDNEHVWDSKTTQVVKRWIQKDVKNNECVHISINFSLMETIFVNNVIVMEKLPNIGKYIYKVNLRRSLIEKQFGFLCKDKNSTLRQFAEELNLFDQQEKGNLPENQDDCENLLTTSKSLQEQESDEEEKEEKDGEIIPNGIIKVVPLSKEVITRKKDQQKPFERWADLVINEVTFVEFEKSENGKWDEFFLFHNAEDVQEKFEELQNIIDDHIEKVQNEQLNKDDCLAPLDDCLVHFAGFYCRGKIHSIYKSNEAKLYRIFLCDFGCYTLLNREELSLKLHTTSKKIIEFMPFQAIQCKLIGVQLDPQVCQRYKATAENLFCYAIKEYQSDGVFSFRSFEIILYECDEIVDLSKENMVNYKLVIGDFAIYDNATKHHLELEAIRIKDTKNDNCYLESAHFENFIRCLDICLTLENEQESYEIYEENLNNIEDGRRRKAELLPMVIEEISNESEITNTNGCQSIDEQHQISNLKKFYKRPKTTWFETDYIICLSIYAPDITDYYLKVTCDCVLFFTEIHNEEYVLILNLLGTVDLKYVSHEIRGLYVKILLVKSIFMKWPRLLVQSTKFQWLSYDINTINTNEMNNLLIPEMKIDRINPNNSGYSSGSDESELNYLENYTPIVNSEDIQDPIAELY